MTTRRHFLGTLIASSFAPSLAWAEIGLPSFLSAGMTRDSRHVLCGIDQHGNILFELPLPARGHAAAAHPHKAEAVMFARRPGTFAFVIDCARGATRASLNLPEGHHFYGHGCYSADGLRLYTTENDYANAQGMVGIWDVSDNYRRIGAVSSGGIGPHDIKLMPGGQALVVANGGIETHPETGRVKLNIPTMQPNLAYLNNEGQLQEVAKLPPELHKNSIRHLAVSQQGTVAIGLQWQGDISDIRPLVAWHQQGKPITFFDAPDALWRKLNSYVGSVAIDTHSRLVAATSPRGGTVQLHALDGTRPVREFMQADVCGVAAQGDGFVMTSGLGVLSTINTQGEQNLAAAELQWDNHLVAL